MNINHIATAFDTLVKGFEQEIAETGTKGADAFNRKDFPAATALAEAATRLNEYKSQVAAIEKQWSTDPLSSGKPNKKQRRGKDRPTKRAVFDAHYLHATETKLGLTFKREKRSFYYSGDGTTAFVCVAATQQQGASFPHYWFTIWPPQADFLAKHKQAFLVLGCGSPESIFAIPFPEFETWRKKPSIYQRDKMSRSDIRITGEARGFYLHLTGRKEKVEITRFLLK